MRKFKSVLILALLLSLFSSQLIAAEPTQVPASNRLAIFLYGMSGSNEIKIHMKASWRLLSRVLLANGFESAQIVRLSEAPENQQILKKDLASVKNTIQETLAELAASGVYDELFVFVCGHANGRDEFAKLHIPGADVDYASLLSWFSEIKAVKSTFVIAAPQGDAWIEHLGDPSRKIIAGNGLREFDVIPIVFLQNFPRKFWQTLQIAENKASASKPTLDTEIQFVSLYDVLSKTQSDVQHWYERNLLYPTEKGLFDIDGDKKGDYFEPPLAANPVLETYYAMQPESAIANQESPDILAAQGSIYTVPGKGVQGL